MTTRTASTPKYLLQELNALNADGLGIHGVVDVEASALGEMLRAETIVQPGGGGGPLHRHRFQEERFEILEGEIIGRIGRTRRRVRAGETFVVPPDAPHTFAVEADSRRSSSRRPIRRRKRLHDDPEQRCSKRSHAR